MEKSTSSTLMTEGSIWKKIIAFAVPLFLGNLFQQLYNTADSLIVGNFLGSNALAAVSSSGNLIFLLVGFFNGIAIGAGVVIARYYGAGRHDDVQKAVHTTIAFGLAAGAALTVIGVVLAPMILVWMGTPADVLPESTVYFRTYFAGSLSFVMYNVFVGILQSVGDSRHPLVYLIISSLINIVLDLVLVGIFHFGVEAAAFATIVSQFVSAFLCLRRLMRSPAEYRVCLKKIRFDTALLRQIIANGLPAGFQNSVISLANVVVQSNINRFGKMAMAILILGVTMVAAPGVPGGAIAAAQGVLMGFLGFSPELYSLMVALYVAIDSIGTATNVTGDGAIALIVNKLAGGSLGSEKGKAMSTAETIVSATD